MAHYYRPPEQDNVLRPRLVDRIDLRHELVKLTTPIDWKVFKRGWAGFSASPTGRLAMPSIVVADHRGRAQIWRHRPEQREACGGRHDCDGKDDHLSHGRQALPSGEKTFDDIHPEPQEDSSH